MNREKETVVDGICRLGYESPDKIIYGLSKGGLHGLPISYGQVIICDSRPTNLKHDMWYGARNQESHVLISAGQQFIKSILIDYDATPNLQKYKGKIWGDLNLLLVTDPVSISEHLLKIFFPRLFYSSQRPYLESDFEACVEAIPHLLEQIVDYEESRKKRILEIALSQRLR